METVEKLCANPRCGITFVVAKRYATRKRFCTDACAARHQTHEWRNRPENIDKARASNRAWHEAHKGDANAGRRMRREANVEHEKENVRRWHAAHRDRVRELNKAWYAEHREEQLAKMKIYNARRRDTDGARLSAEARERHQAARRNTPWVRMLRGAKERAAKKGVPFDLTLEWIQERWTGKCELTGIEFRLDPPGTPGQRMMAPSIDRREPSKGYVQENCRVILWAINAMKSDGTDEMLNDIFQAIGITKRLGS